MGISREQALECFASDDLIGIGMEADAVRRRLHPEGVVSYAVDGRVDVDGGLAAICTQVEDTIERDGSGVVLRGGAELRIAEVEQLLATMRERFPAVWLHGLSASGIQATARNSGVTVQDTLARLRDAGLGSIGGEDAEILDDAVQRGARCSKAEWLGVHRAAHALGMPTTAAMIFGGGETMEHRVNHLEAVRQLQEETGGFTAFTPSAFQMHGSVATVPGWEEATGVEYLKTLAISRMYLDNIENVQANLETQGLKVLQVGLRFGGNDVGSVPETVPGSGKCIAEEDLRRVIRDAGFRPVQRDLLYRTMYWN